MNNLVLEDTMKGKFLTFSLDAEHYGIDIHYVTEIVGLQPITDMPEMPEFIRGVINLRGKIIPVMDARIKFGKEEKDYNDRTCTIVVEFKEVLIGIIVDAVSEVMTIDEINIVPPPIIGNKGRNYIKNIAKNDKAVILIIDCEALLNETELGSIQGVKQ